MDPKKEKELKKIKEAKEAKEAKELKKIKEANEDKEAKEAKELKRQLKIQSKQKKKDNEKELDEIIQNFNKQITLLFKFIETKDKISNNPDVEKAIRMVKIAKNISRDSLIEGSMDNLWENRELIINRDETFIMLDNLDKYVDNNDEDKELIESLFSFLRKIYKNFARGEIDYLWDCINNMLQCVIRYRIIKGDFA